MSTAKHGVIFRFGLDIGSELKRRPRESTIQILTCILRKHVRGPWYFYNCIERTFKCHWVNEAKILCARLMFTGTWLIILVSSCHSVLDCYVEYTSILCYTPHNVFSENLFFQVTWKFQCPQHEQIVVAESFPFQKPLTQVVNLSELNILQARAEIEKSATWELEFWASKRIEGVYHLFVHGFAHRIHVWYIHPHLP